MRMDTAVTVALKLWKLRDGVIAAPLLDACPRLMGDDRRAATGSAARRVRMGPWRGA